jgi:hypothetical protein
MQPPPPRGANENALGYTQIRFSYFPARHVDCFFGATETFWTSTIKTRFPLLLPPSFTSIFHFLGKDGLKFEQFLSLSRMSSIWLLSHEIPRPSPFQRLP